MARLVAVVPAHVPGQNTQYENDRYRQAHDRQRAPQRLNFRNCTLTAAGLAR